MTDASTIASRLADFLGTEIRASQSAGRIAVLTPAEYPDREGVTVYVEATPEGYMVSDLGVADASMIGSVNERQMERPAAEIARRLDVSFEDGRMVSPATDEDLPEVCWRVAQASAAIAAAPLFAERRSPRASRELVDLLVSALTSRDVTVERERVIPGQSGHQHRASLYVPASETILEPVAGQQPWRAAALVLAEFEDLRLMNGYRLCAVLDDRNADLEQEASLLGRVAKVMRWSQHDEWITQLRE
jgi:hypothetical protein